MRQVGYLQGVYRLVYGLDDPGYESLQGEDIFLFFETSGQVPRATHPPMQWVSGFLAGGRAGEA